MLSDHRPGRHRRVVAGGLRRTGRLRELLTAGVIDSFGMALGWTVLVLLAVDRGGLAEAALYNAAMLAGVVLSAPITGWLSRRLPGRRLLRSTAGAEIVLRVAVLWGLIAGAPSWSIAAGVAIMHVAAWAGFAGMRAEVTAVAPGPKAMTRYALGIAAVEAAGTGLAALLPAGPGGYPTGWWLTAVFIVYAGSLLPTIHSARRARVRPDTTFPAPHAAFTPSGRPDTTLPAPLAALAPIGRPVAACHDSAPRRAAVSPRLLAAGGGVMLLAAGPTLLAVPLTTELHGRAWVAGAAVAFSLGCLLATVAVEAIGSMRLPAVLRWSLFGLGMLIGWMFAPAHAYAVLFAQFAAGLSQTAFEGDMDARVAAEAPPKSVTTALAYSASVRALGGSIAVKALPVLVTAQSVDRAVSAAALILGVASLLLYTATLIPRSARRSATATPT
jgi:MFS family permease